MKNFTQLTLTLSTVIFLSACGGPNMPAPSQNTALNSISSSSASKKDGFMQSSLETWLKDDWTPSVEKDKDIRKKYMKEEKGETVSKSDTVESTSESTSSTTAQETTYVEDTDRNFTLQEYVDKTGAYIKAHEGEHKASNVKKLNSMPVIGE